MRSVTTLPAPACTPAQIEATVKPEKPSYQPGAVIFVIGTLRNRSAVTCSHTGVTVEFTFRNAAGETVRRTGPPATSTAPRPLLPGATLNAPGGWSYTDQPAGTYTATATWSFAGNGYEASAAFELA